MNIVITGASKGIGFELVKKFAIAGSHNLAIIARTDNKLADIKKICQRANSNSTIIPIVFDLSRIENYESELIPKILEALGSVDILINNAGYLVNKPFEHQTNDDIYAMIGVNLLAPMKLTQSLLPYLAKGCHVVNISSMGGYQGSQKFSGLSVYSSAKAGLACLTECLAEEYKNKDIRFNCLAIGATDTEMLREAFPGYKPPFTASDMADFIADFAIYKAKFFNGKVIPVTISTP